jgi:predicted MFS family arabinose efflux permease
MLGAANGVGAMAGLMLVNWSRDRRSNEAIFAGGSLLGCIGLLGLSLSTSFPWSLAALVTSGVGLAGFSIMQSSIILVEATDEMRSRAMGALVLAIGSGPIGRVQGGAMAAAWGAPLALGSMALSAAAGILAVAWLLRGFLTSSGRPPR